jgi:(p)ppGpp synthase/HD superfamily hydrolase
VRKGARSPYIGRLPGVAGIVIEHGGDGDQAIAGLLHDAIEDAGAERGAVILDRFGPRVASIVRACTDGGHRAQAALAGPPGGVHRAP